MKRTYTDQEIVRILNQELEIPDKVNQGMQEAYRKLGMEKQGRTVFVRRRRMWRALMVAAALTAGSSMAVLAASKFLSANLVKESDSVKYDLTVDQTREAHEVEVKPTYMPKGYLWADGDKSSSGGKWRNDETGDMITIWAKNAAELDAQVRLGDTEYLTPGLKEDDLKKEIEINGMKMVMFQSDGDYIESVDTRKKVMLFNEEEGYLIEIFNDSTLPMEEIEKIAEGLDIRVLDSTVPYMTDKEIEEILADREASREDSAPVVLSDNVFFPVGQELRCPFVAWENDEVPDDLRYTVESIEVKDSLSASEYPTENYIDYEGEVAEWLNEDGTLKPHERFRYELDENGFEVGDPATETVGSKFVVVRMKLKNNKSGDVSNDEVFVAPSMQHLKKNENGKYVRYAYDAEYCPANEGYHLGTADGFPEYFDKMYYTEGIKRLKHACFIPMMEQGDEMEYTLVYVVDEDRLDDAFLSFYEVLRYWPREEGANKYTYVKVVQ